MNKIRSSSRRKGDTPVSTNPGQKRTWHPLTLQQMHQSQFIEVVNGILSGRSEVFQGSLKGASGLPDLEGAWEFGQAN